MLQHNQIQCVFKTIDMGKGRKMNRQLVCAAIVLLASCYVTDSLHAQKPIFDAAENAGVSKSSLDQMPSQSALNGNQISFTTQVAPIIVAKCGKCHVTQSKGKFGIPTYDALMASESVKAGAADTSQLIEIIESGEMPKGGDKVSPEEMTLLKTWINAGAKNDGANDVSLNQLAGGGTSLASPQGLAALEGDWTGDSASLEGNSVNASQMTLQFSSGAFQARSGQMSSNGTLKLATDDGQLTFSIDGGADAGKKIPALYRVENGILTITYSQDDQFPTSHNSTSANKYCSVTFRKGASGQSIADGSGSASAAAAGGPPSDGPPGAAVDFAAPPAGGGGKRAMMNKGQ